MFKIAYIISLSLLFLISCNEKPATVVQEKKKLSLSVVPEVTVIKEMFTTLRDENDNVDSPAIWHGKDGQHWLLATAKEGNVIIVYDADTGELINRFGKFGKAIGDLSRPNGIAVIDDIAIIVERDNHRIQLFSLPDFSPIGFFGDSVLRFPYGLTIDKFEEMYNIYVTDNYESADGEIPPTDSLGQRVHHFTFKVERNSLVANHIKAFGDITGNGILNKVESLLIDRIHNRLLIADEYEAQCNVKIYDLEGNFTGQILPHNYFFYEPEGIVVWRCDSDSSGYYIIVDQGKINNTFQVFDRKTLEYIGGFSGELTRNTDGIALTQKSFGNFKHGAFYPIHNDGNVAAISWEDIAKALDLKYNCD